MRIVRGMERELRKYGDPVLRVKASAVAGVDEALRTLADDMAETMRAEDGIAEALCPGIDPPRCCRAYDTRFLPRAMEKTIANPKPYVEFDLVNV